MDLSANRCKMWAHEVSDPISPMVHRFTPRGQSYPTTVIRRRYHPSLLICIHVSAISRVPGKTHTYRLLLAASGQWEAAQVSEHDHDPLSAWPGTPSRSHCASPPWSHVWGLRASLAAEGATLSTHVKKMFSPDRIAVRIRRATMASRASEEGMQGRE